MNPIIQAADVKTYGQLVNFFQDDESVVAAQGNQFAQRKFEELKSMNETIEKFKAIVAEEAFDRVIVQEMDLDIAQKTSELVLKLHSANNVEKITSKIDSILTKAFQALLVVSIILSIVCLNPLPFFAALILGGAATLGLMAIPNLIDSIVSYQALDKLEESEELIENNPELQTLLIQQGFFSTPLQVIELV